MIRELKYFFDRYCYQYSAKELHKLMLYIAFVQKFCVKYSIKLPDNMEPEGLLYSLFQAVPGYEVKDAAITLENSIPWSLFKENSSLYGNLKHFIVNTNYRDYINNDWFYNQAAPLLYSEGAQLLPTTPKSICELVAELAKNKHTDEIVDICSGTYSLGLKVWDKMGRSSGIACFGEESDVFLCAISRLLLFFCGVTNFSIKEKNIIISDYISETNPEHSKIFVCDLPPTGSNTILIDKNRLLFDKMNETAVYSDWFIIEKILSRMHSTDMAFLLVTKGALTRNREKSIRKKLIEYDYIDSIIHIPAGVYYEHNLPMELMVLQKERINERKNRVLFADLSDFTIQGQQKKDLSDEGIFKIGQAFKHFDCKENMCRTVSTEEIAGKDYSLYPYVYLSSNENRKNGLALGEVAEVIRGIQGVSHKSAQGEQLLLNVKSIKNDAIDYSEAQHFQLKSGAKSEKYLIREDDIILTSKGANLKIAIVNQAPPSAYISENLTIIRMKTDAYSPYVLYEFLISDSGKAALELIQTGTTVRVLSSRKLELLKIPEYNSKTACIIGDSLKLAMQKYTKTLEKATALYQDKKRDLFAQLG